MAKQQDTVNHSADHSIDQIRDIIFGEKLNEYEKIISQLKQECRNLRDRIDTLEKKYSDDLSRFTAEHSEKLSQTESSQQEIKKLIEKLKKEFDQKIQALSEGKVDKSQIGQAFIEWGMKVKQTATNKG